MTVMLDGDAGRREPFRVGVAFVAHRIEFGSMDDGGRKPRQIGRAQRRYQGIGGVGAIRQIVGEIRLEQGAVEQIIFRKRIALRRCSAEIKHRADQAL